MTLNERTADLGSIFTSELCKGDVCTSLAVNDRLQIVSSRTQVQSPPSALAEDQPLFVISTTCRQGQIIEARMPMGFPKTGPRR